ncbi:MAG: hypothetical protein K8F54_00785 [Altibacter sp.]|uniref:DUF7793 family protein n=1 Tax=Altibacter sp. TaxID=2024823 RepID=UPI001DD4DBDF|nr:hypothetical protein [Altibacter sp.]MBZ0326114.1 hypothetical protein [Altibacter sp.]
MKMSIMSDNSILFEKAKFKMDKGILFCEFFNTDMCQRLHEEIVHLYIQAMTALCNGNPTPFLIDVRKTTGTYTIHAAKLFANSPELKRVRISEAYVLDTNAMKLLISSYKRIYEPLTPFVIVNNLEQAITFCLESKKEHDTVN